MRRRTRTGAAARLVPALGLGRGAQVARSTRRADRHRPHQDLRRTRSSPSRSPEPSRSSSARHDLGVLRGSRVSERPFVTRAWVRWRVKKVRDEFADQLPPNLQVLASGLRAGFTLLGAFVAMVENASEPSKSEFERVDHRRAARRPARGGDPQGCRADGQSRPRTARAARRAPAHDRRQRGRGARRDRPHRSRARRHPAARADADHAGPDGALDPDRACRSRPALHSGRCSRTSSGRCGTAPVGQFILLVAAILVALGSYSIQKIIEIEV